MDAHKISRSMRWVTILPLDKDSWPSAPCPTLRELWVGVSSSKISESPCGAWGQRADTAAPAGLPWLRTRALGDLCFSLSLYPVCCPEDIWALCLWVLWLSSGSLRVSWQQLAPAGYCSISFIGSCEIGRQNGAELGLAWGAEWGWGWGSGSLVAHCWPSGLEQHELPPAIVLPVAHGTWGQQG